MTDEQFNELIEKATETLEPGNVVQFLDTALRLVVKATGAAGEIALLRFCAACQEKANRNAG